MNDDNNQSPNVSYYQQQQQILRERDTILIDDNFSNTVLSSYFPKKSFLSSVAQNSKGKSFLKSNQSTQLNQAKSFLRKENLNYNDEEDDDDNNNNNNNIDDDDDQNSEPSNQQQENNQEHNQFLQSLKLLQNSWQNIEEPEQKKKEKPIHLKNTVNNIVPNQNNVINNPNNFQFSLEDLYPEDHQQKLNQFKKEQKLNLNQFQENQQQEDDNFIEIQNIHGKYKKMLQQLSYNHDENTLSRLTELLKNDNLNDFEIQNNLEKLSLEEKQLIYQLQKEQQQNQNIQRQKNFNSQFNQIIENQRIKLAPEHLFLQKNDQQFEEYPEKDHYNDQEMPRQAYAVFNQDFPSLQVQELTNQNQEFIQNYPNQQNQEDINLQQMQNNYPHQKNYDDNNKIQQQQEEDNSLQMQYDYSNNQNQELSNNNKQQVNFVQMQNDYPFQQNIIKNNNNRNKQEDNFQQIHTDSYNEQISNNNNKTEQEVKSLKMQNDYPFEQNQEFITNKQESNSQLYPQNDQPYYYQNQESINSNNNPNQQEIEVDKMFELIENFANQPITQQKITELIKATELQNPKEAEALIQTFEQNKLNKLEIMSKQEREQFVNDVISRIFQNVNKNKQGQQYDQIRMQKQQRKVRQEKQKEEGKKTQNKFLENFKNICEILENIDDQQHQYEYIAKEINVETNQQTQNIAMNQPKIQQSQFNTKLNQILTQLNDLSPENQQK